MLRSSSLLQVLNTKIEVTVITGRTSCKSRPKVETKTEHK